MLFSDVLFAVMAASQKMAGRTLPAAEVVFVRSLFSMGFVGILLARNRVPLRANEPGLLCARAVFGFAALQMYFWAIPQIALGTAVMLNYLAPIAAVILSFYALHERPQSGVKFMLLLSFIGVYALTAPHTASRLLPLGAAALSGLLAGSVQVMIRQSGRTDSPLLVVFYFTVACVIGSGLLLLKTGFVRPNALEWSALALVTLSSLAGQLCMTTALMEAPIWVVSPLGYLTPVLGALLGYLFWKEIPTPLNAAGAMMVIGCGVAMLLNSRKVWTTSSDKP